MCLKILDRRTVLKHCTYAVIDEVLWLLWFLRLLGWASWRKFGSSLELRKADDGGTRLWGRLRKLQISQTSNPVQWKARKLAVSFQEDCVCSGAGLRETSVAGNSFQQYDGRQWGSWEAGEASVKLSKFHLPFVTCPHSYEMSVRNWLFLWGEQEDDAEAFLPKHVQLRVRNLDLERETGKKKLRVFRTWHEGYQEYEESLVGVLGEDHDDPSMPICFIGCEVDCWRWHHERWQQSVPPLASRNLISARPE